MYNNAGTGGPTAAGSVGNWTNSWGPLTNSGSAGSSEYCMFKFLLILSKFCIIKKVGGEIICKNLKGMFNFKNF